MDWSSTSLTHSHLIMDNNEYILKLQNYKPDLIRIVNYHGIFFQVDDILQELYVKLLVHNDINRYVKDGEPNMFIIFIMIRNIIYDFRKKEYKYVELNSEFDLIEDEDNDIDKYNFLIEEIENMEYWFNKKIVEIYFNYLDGEIKYENKHTIRSLSKETKIGKHVIQKVIYKFKQDCINKLKIKTDNL